MTNQKKIIYDDNVWYGITDDGLLVTGSHSDALNWAEKRGIKSEIETKRCFVFGSIQAVRGSNLVELVETARQQNWKNLANNLFLHDIGF
jgi:hypothetical protein